MIFFNRERVGVLRAGQSWASAPYVAKTGAGSGMSFAIFLRFWAVARPIGTHLWLRSARAGGIDRA
jgi:hypothetical protein